MSMTLITSANGMLSTVHVGSGPDGRHRDSSGIDPAPADRLAGVGSDTDVHVARLALQVQPPPGAQRYGVPVEGVLRIPVLRPHPDAGVAGPAPHERDARPGCSQGENENLPMTADGS